MAAYVIAVDFDGTLCTNAWPNIGRPRDGVISYVTRQKQSGAKLILWTNRHGKRLDEAVVWCNEHGISFDAVNENLPESIALFGGDTRKVYADEYIDDKAMTADEAERRSGRIANRRLNFRNRR